ncbi:MAG TPA: pyruvate kinase [Candidatus Saccharimonadales bacterium]|nr:pyruvate kinase [Candidatus Saccharimonadales bacterium]
MTTPKVFKRAKILATLGPATDSYEAILELIQSGVNGFRLNFSHGTYEERDRQIPWIRKASKVLGKPVAILQDLQGPKISLGDFEGTVPVTMGEKWSLMYGAAPNPDKKVLPIQYDLSKKCKVGERLYLFDGKVKSQIIAVKPGELIIHIENDGVLMQRKGINVPDTSFGGDVLTTKDIKDIAYGAGKDIDFVAMSFVQTADDVKKLRALLEEHKSTAKVIPKIETQVAIRNENLEAIIMVADGVMVARGDLAVETSPEIVPIVQRQILHLAQKHGKISIVATQMMASMQTNPEPTRAEVSDVANAVITGADCVMLSDETANGRYPIETVATMKRVIMYTQEHAPVRPLFFSEHNSTLQDAISSAAITLAHQIKAQAIVCETKTGATALSIAAHRPSMAIISVTSDPQVAQQLCLLYANKSFLRPEGEKAGLQLAQDLADLGLLTKGERVVLVSGRQPGLTGGTDTIRVRVLE